MSSAAEKHHIGETSHGIKSDKMDVLVANMRDQAVHDQVQKVPQISFENIRFPCLPGPKNITAAR